MNIRQLLYHFAVGDALGEPFEFQSPTKEDIETRFTGLSNFDASKLSLAEDASRLSSTISALNYKLSFTDDTYLLASTLFSLNEALSFYEENDLERFWFTMKIATCEELVKWMMTKDLRGIGSTTKSAIDQMVAHHIEKSSYDDFSLSPERGYDYSISAGNGCLSRAIPLLLLDLPFDERYREWLKLTHLHLDGIKAVEDMILYVQKSKTPNLAHLGPNIKGFYAPETLKIAINSIESSSELGEVFAKSQFPQGDNDSTAALAFALWYLKTGKEMNEGLMVRVDERDKKFLESLSR